jgi:hypothetical protein
MRENWGWMSRQGQKVSPVLNHPAPSMTFGVSFRQFVIVSSTACAPIGPPPCIPIGWGPCDRQRLVSTLCPGARSVLWLGQESHFSLWSGTRGDSCQAFGLSLGPVSGHNIVCTVPASFSVSILWWLRRPWAWMFVYTWIDAVQCTGQVDTDLHSCERCVPWGLLHIWNDFGFFSFMHKESKEAACRLQYINQCVVSFCLGFASP